MSAGAVIVNQPGVFLVDDAGNAVGVVLDGAVYRLQVEATLAAGSERVKVWDGVDILDILGEAVTTTGLKGVLAVAKTGLDQATFLLAQPDGSLVTASKPPAPPPGTTPYQSAVDDAELIVGAGGDVASPHTSLGPIVPNGELLTLQSVEIGTEGDSSENGSVIEVYWREGGGPTDHLVGRYYVAGETVQVILPDVAEARDGTPLTGDGSTTRIVTVRRRLSLAALEIDFVVRGYTA